MSNIPKSEEALLSEVAIEGLKDDVSSLAMNQSLLDSMIKRDRDSIDEKVALLQSMIPSLDVEEILNDQEILKMIIASNKKDIEEKLSLLEQHCSGNDANISDISGRLYLMEFLSAKKTGQVQTADVAAAPVAYDQAHMDTVVALLNELKGILNSMNQ